MKYSQEHNAWVDEETGELIIEHENGEIEATPIERLEELMSEEAAVDTSSYVRFEGTRMIFRRDTPFEVWCASFSQLHTAVRYIQWWMADAYIQGKDMYADRIYAVLDELDYKEHTLDNWVAVARSVPVDRRKEDLSWSHHAEIAPLPEDVGDELLERAHVERLPVAEVRKLKKQWQMENQEMEFGPAEVVEVCPHCGQPMPPAAP